MARMMRLCPFLLLIAASFAADPSSFALWTRSTIGEHEATLMKNVSPDHSSLETPADYGDHRFRLLYRDADGLPEEHDKIVDVVIAQRRRRATAGEYLGAALTGGESQPLAVGDIVHIPAGIRHRFLVPAGKHITYVLLKFPAKRQ